MKKGDLVLVEIDDNFYALVQMLTRHRGSDIWISSSRASDILADWEVYPKDPDYKYTPLPDYTKEEALIYARLVSNTEGYVVPEDEQ